MENVGLEQEKVSSAAEIPPPPVDKDLWNKINEGAQTFAGQGGRFLGGDVRRRSGVIHSFVSPSGD